MAVTPEASVVVTIAPCVDPSKIADCIGGAAQLRPITGYYEQIVVLECDPTGTWKGPGRLPSSRRAGPGTPAGPLP